MLIKKKKMESLHFFYYRVKWQLQTTKRGPEEKFLVIGISWYKKIQVRWKTKSL